MANTNVQVDGLPPAVLARDFGRRGGSGLGSDEAAARRGDIFLPPTPSVLYCPPCLVDFASPPAPA